MLSHRVVRVGRATCSQLSLLHHRLKVALPPMKPSWRPFHCLRAFSSIVDHSNGLRVDDELDEVPLPLDEGGKAAMKQPVIDEFGRAYGTGRRKTSVARVWVKDGSGVFIVNDKEFVDYFQPLQRMHVLEAFEASKTAGLFDVWCTVKGGGMSGQAGAVRLGISRALEAFDPNLRPSLSRAGMLTRDSRRVERKKPGQKKARKKFQVRGLFLVNLLLSSRSGLRDSPLLVDYLSQALLSVASSKLPGSRNSCASVDSDHIFDVFFRDDDLAYHEFSSDLESSMTF